MRVSVEVTDCAFGCPAQGVPGVLLRQVDGYWLDEDRIRTDDVGCARLASAASGQGRYRLVIDVEKYYSGLGVPACQCRADITFRVSTWDAEVHFAFTVTPWSMTAHRVLAGAKDE